MLQLLQHTASESDAESIAATVYAVSSMAPFIAAVENNSGNYSMLAKAAAAALQAGNRCAKRLMSLSVQYAMFMAGHQIFHVFAAVVQVKIKSNYSVTEQQYGAQDRCSDCLFTFSCN